MSEKCSVGNSRTVAPAAVYSVDCDTALGPTRMLENAAHGVGHSRAVAPTAPAGKRYAGKCNVYYMQMFIPDAAAPLPFRRQGA